MSSSSPRPCRPHADVRFVFVSDDQFEGRKLTELINEKHENVKYLSVPSHPLSGGTRPLNTVWPDRRALTLMHPTASLFSG